MDENTQAKFAEKIKELLNMAKKKKNVLEYQEISDFFADMPLEEEQMEKVLEYLDQNNVDVLRITDDGVGMPPEQVAHLLDEPAEGAEKAEKFRHVGLWNVNRRIRYSFGEGYGLTIESEEDVGTEVTIRLPYQQKGDSHAADITGG